MNISWKHLDEQQRLVLLNALIARHGMALRAQMYYDASHPNDYHVCVHIHDSVSFFIQDFLKGQHDPENISRNIVL